MSVEILIVTDLPSRLLKQFQAYFSDRQQAYLTTPQTCSEPPSRNLGFSDQLGWSQVEQIS